MQSYAIVDCTSFGATCGDQSPCLRRGLGVGQICKCGRGPQGMH